MTSEAIPVCDINKWAETTWITKIACGWSRDTQGFDMDTWR